MIALIASLWAVRFATYTLATVFYPYDDEGYFLLALQRYFRPGAPDPETFSHYGPFYYFVQLAFFGLPELPVTHDSGRLITLLCWIGSAVLAGVFVCRVTRSLLLGAAAFTSCVSIASVLAHEPGHPQQIVLVLLTLAGCLSLNLNSGVARFLLGAVGVALVFTKINVGVFYLAALGHALICLLPDGWYRSSGRTVLLIYAVVAPPMLAHSYLFSGAGAWCIVAASVTAITFWWGAAYQPPTSVRPGQTVAIIAGTFAALSLILLGTLYRGVSPGALVEGVLLEPARNPAGSWFVGFRLGWPWALGTLLILGVISAIARYRDLLAPYRFWIGVLRCCAGLGVILLLVRTDLAFAIPFLPLGVIPLTHRPWSLAEWFPRLFIADLAATQFLQTYPVAGSQIGIASVPVLLSAFVCLCDGLEEMNADAVWKPAAAAFVLLVVAAVMRLSGVPWSGYPFPPSHLRGADSLHLPPDQAATYRALSRLAAANCSVLYTVPKLGSFNLWSGIPAPEESYATSSMPPARQQRILALLQSDTRACVVDSPDLLRLRQIEPGALKRQPLTRYIYLEMPKAVAISDYEIRIHPHRTAPWIP
jgi:hypothetical protein